MKVKIKLIEGGKAPIFKRNGDACLDCFALQNTVVYPNKRKLVRLGFALEIPNGYEAVIRPRSGLSSQGIDISIGTIDSNYRGEVMVCVINNSNTVFLAKAGDRICQLAVRKTEDIEWVITDDLSDSNRGDNGFGSSGL